MSFQIHALPADEFRPLFEMSDDELAEHRAKRMVVDTKPGYPCRVSLVDAEIGETVILTNHVHQPSESPFRASHAIFVRQNAEQANPEVGEVPEFLTTRLLSIRAYDFHHDMICADVVEGSALPDLIPKLFEDPRMTYLHLHNAQPGCYNARVTRANVPAV